MLFQTVKITRKYFGQALCIIRHEYNEANTQGFKNMDIM